MGYEKENCKLAQGFFWVGWGKLRSDSLLEAMDV